jgi:hypothetical protein
MSRDAIRGYLGPAGRAPRRAELAWGLARAARLAAMSVLAAALLTLTSPVPAAAHIAGAGGSPSNYRVVVTELRPAVAGVVVTVGVGGQWVRVTNLGAGTIEVLGYHGEPFLRLSAHRVQANELSTTAAQTGQVRAAAGLAGTPGSPGLPAPPRWVTLRDGDSVTWTDARIAPAALPEPPARASATWQLPLLVNGRPVTALGTRELIPPPSPWPWVAALVLLTAGVAAIGWRRDWYRPIAGATTVGVLAFVIHLIGTGFTPQQNGPVFGWIGVGAVGAFCLIIGTITVVSAARKRDAAAARVITTGTMVLLLAFTDITALWNSQLPFAGPASLDRALTVLAYGTALGLFIAGLRLTRAAAARVPPKSVSS